MDPLMHTNNTHANAEFGFNGNWETELIYTKM